MPITVYRVDARSPTEIQGADGFQPKGLHLDIDVARALLVRATLDPNVVVDFPTGRGQSIRDWLDSVPGVISINDLYVKVQSFGKDIDAFQVSTERGEGGGGQAGGGILYRIEVPTPLYQWNSSGFRNAPVCTAVNTDADLSTSPVGKCLLTDSRLATANQPAAWDSRRSVETAGILALSSYTSMCAEIAFLNAIPYAWITRYRPARGVWRPMP